ncbi:uncharacterized protein EV420DRAFT_1749593 [Desarmillaria tabescens]|uniref:Uncharacterized protein n=1 Tax=Armillaria tabescens TaxID=1929756 RepID=A0AA39K471_ARMTA|nr:uncharacterized protein EV420DRAFT_1749593 [Desarmillaria tabescens]KAK0454032.1 hypothetical protein EV420DRAFT_1749593 [Desarmillaria tabescens]
MTRIYTGIFAVMLWNIFINKCWPIRAMVAVVILLYALVTIDVAAAFIDYGQSFFPIFLKLNGNTEATFLVISIAASMSTVLADLYMIWYCWRIWGRRWLVVVLPVLSLISATVSKTIEVYYQYFDLNGSTQKFQILYMSFILATTLWCTSFIIYHILTVTGVRHEAEGRSRVYHHFIEVLVESSALYSISLILTLTFIIQNNLGVYYVDVTAAIVKYFVSTTSRYHQVYNIKEQSLLAKHVSTSKREIWVIGKEVPVFWGQACSLLSRRTWFCTTVKNCETAMKDNGETSFLSVGAYRMSNPPILCSWHLQGDEHEVTHWRSIR